MSILQALPPPSAQARRRVRERGFAMVLVVWVLVLLTGLVLWAARSQQQQAQQSVQAARQAQASLAARAALQWAAWVLSDPRGSLRPGANALPDCADVATPPALPQSLSEARLSLSCSRWPPSPDAEFYAEDQRRLRYFVLVATASLGAAASPDFVERRLEMRLEVCKDPASTEPNFRCEPSRSSAP